MNDLCKKSGIYMLPLGFTGPQIWSDQEIPPPKKRKRKRVFFQYPTSSHLLYCSNHSIDKPTLSILSWTCPEQGRKDKRKQRTNIETIDFRRKFDFYYFLQKKKKKKRTKSALTPIFLLHFYTFRVILRLLSYIYFLAFLNKKYT